MSETLHPHVAIAVATCRRPRMLAGLLASFAAMDKPREVTVTFLVIDNAPDAPVDEVVAQWRTETGLDGRYVLEREPGIPYARNRGLDEALAMGADFLAYVDDDEVVDQRWLVAILAHQQANASHLVGGPVRCNPPSDATLVHRFLYNGVRQRYRRKEAKNARKREQGRDGTVTILTNNWFGDLAWFRATGLRFDIALRYSGGSDTALHHAAKRLGAETTWCPEAIVSETVPVGRLSIAYQFRRARDQAATSFWRKAATERRSLPVNIATSAGKIVFGLLLVVVSPLTLGRTLVDGVRMLGYGVGYALALAGRRSRHYEVLQGD